MESAVENPHQLLVVALATETKRIGAYPRGFVCRGERIVELRHDLDKKTRQTKEAELALSNLQV
jgi:hypothetical protein